MPFRRGRRHYQQFIEIERGHALHDLIQSGYEKVDIHFVILQKDMEIIYPLCTIPGSRGQGNILLQDDHVPGVHIVLLRGKTAVFGVKLWRNVLCLQQKV